MNSLSQPLPLFARRTLMALVALVILLAAVPQVASAAPFGIRTLRQGSSAGAENYLYTDGGTVFAQAMVDAGSYYRFTVLDAGGAVRAQTNCVQALFKKQANSKYAIQPADPVTSSTAWRFRLDEWNNLACSGSPAKTSSLYFDIARASSYADSGLTTARSTYPAGSAAYVKVAGLGRVKTSAANSAVSDWQATWVLPSGATACANTASADRPDSDAGGLLPGGSFLKYRPNAGNPSQAWNLESNYETGPCQDFAQANEGDWRLRVQKDSTHFVTLKAFTVDATPPDTTITSAPVGGTPFTSPDLDFVASQPDATFECQLDGGGWASCTSPKHYSGLSESTHTFQVRAIDPAGNVDPTPASATWTVDTTLPAVALTNPADGVATSDTTPDFSGDAGTAPGDSATVTVKITQPVAGGPDQLVQTLTTTRSGGSWSVTPTVPLAEGSYKVHAEQADDLAGVASSAEHSFRVDTTAPSVAVLEPRIDSVTSDVTPMLWGTGGLDTGDDGDVTVKLWSGPAASGAPDQTATAAVDSAGYWMLDASPALADGTYTVRAEQLDDAGNLGLSRAHTFEVDATAPNTSITAGPSASTASTAASFRFASDEAGASFECLIDDGDWGPCASPKAYSGLASGAHTFMVRATDAAGNEDATPATAAWTVDTTLPGVTLVNPADGHATNDATPTFDGSAGTLAGDSPNVTVKVYRPVAGAPDQLVESLDATRASDGSWSVVANPALPDGDYIARAEQLDDASNVGTSAPHSFTVDTGAPNTLFTQTPPAVMGTTSADLHFDSTEAGASFECRLDSGAWNACTSPELLTGLAAGSHSFNVRATDAAGNTDPTPASASWTIDLSLPDLALEAPADGTRMNDPSPSFSGHAGTAGGDSDTVTLKIYKPVAGGPDTLVQTRTTVRSSLDGSWSVAASPELDDGDYWAHAEQAGSSGTAVSAAVSFTVDTTPPHTQIASGPQGITAATSASFGFTASEAGSSFECRIDGGPWSACTPPQSYSGLASDLHTFDVRAIDVAGNVDPTPASRSWAVDTTGAAVTLEAPLDDALTNDSTPLFSGHASTGAGDSDTVNVEIYRPVAGGADELVQTRGVVRSSTDGSWSVAASPALADGTYVAYATQDDSNANTSYSAPRTFTVDATQPSVTLTAPATGPTNNTTPTLGGGAGTDAGDSATVTVKLYSGSSVSGSPVQTLPATRNGGSWSVDPSALADGIYTAQAEQTDAAGNTGTSGARTFSVDATAPDTTIDSGPSGTTTSTGASFGFSASEIGATYQCKLDAGAWVACSSPRSYSGLAVGSHTFSVRALDALGNADATPAGRTWTVAAPPQGGTGGSGGTPPGGVVTPSGTLTLDFKLSARKRQRFRKRTRALVLSATCGADCAVRVSGKISLSRARSSGLTRRQAAAKRLKLRAATYRLTAGKKTRLRLRVSRKLARQLLAGLKQRRRITVTVKGAATGTNSLSPTRQIRIRLKR
jgi:Bacterial Ig-like domain